MIVLIIDSPKIPTALLEAVMTIDNKVLIVSASDKNELPKDYVVDDFFKKQQEFLIQSFRDIALTPYDDYEYLNFDLPFHFFIPSAISPVGVNITNVQVFNPSTPIRGTPCYNHN